MNFPDFNWILLGTITGVFWGFFAVFWYMEQPKLKGKKKWEKAQTIYAVFFQFFYNLVCGFAGWFCLKIFLNRLSWGHFNFSELLLLCIALLGITGRLSPVMYRLPDALMQKLNKFLGFSN